MAHESTTSSKLEVNERFKEVVEYLLRTDKGLSKTLLSQRFGISKSKLSEILNNRMMAGIEILNQLVLEFGINSHWLLTGDGPMLLKWEATAEPANTAEEPLTKFSTKKDQSYPLVEIRAVAGFGSGDFAIGDRDVKEWYVIPKFKHKKIDFMIEVEGSSMYPKYNSGDVVACKIIQADRFIQWNKTHVVATKDQGIIIKRIKPGSTDQTLTMVSDNQQYDPFEVHMDDITGLALVIGVIRLE